MQSRSALSRSGEVARKSKETQLTAKVVLEGRGRIKVATGLAFLDHMLEQVARFGGFDLALRGAGDMHVDAPHLVEEACLVLGPAVSRALGGRAGTSPYACAYGIP